MKGILLLTTLFVSSVFAQDPTVQIQKTDAYGPGVHMDQYESPVYVQPKSKIRDPFVQIKKKDAYGPGIHMDQYGRPVTIQTK